MKTDLQIGLIATAVADYLKKNKCSPIEAYAIIGMVRHSIDKSVDNEMIKQQLAKGAQKP